MRSAPDRFQPTTQQEPYRLRIESASQAKDPGITYPNVGIQRPVFGVGEGRQKRGAAAGAAIPRCVNTCLGQNGRLLKY
jgi:hypothetical protein